MTWILLGITDKAIRGRIGMGWPVADILTRPVRPY